jgi:peptidyl-tRNA hydrolase
MGYLLGNYIHLTAENYEAHGTKEWKDETSKKVTTKIFKTHEENILALAEKFKVNELDKI